MIEEFPKPQNKKSLENRVELIHTKEKTGDIILAGRKFDHLKNTRSILLDGKKIGFMSYKDCGDYYSIGFITIEEDMRGQGIGEEVYKKLVDSLDKPLRSDIHISESAENLWKKLVDKGLARQIGTIASGRGLYEWIK